MLGYQMDRGLPRPRCHQTSSFPPSSLPPSPSSLEAEPSHSQPPLVFITAYRLDSCSESTSTTPSSSFELKKLSNPSRRTRRLSERILELLLDLTGLELLLSEPKFPDYLPKYLLTFSLLCFTESESNELPSFPVRSFSLPPSSFSSRSSPTNPSHLRCCRRSIPRSLRWSSTGWPSLRRSIRRERCCEFFGISTRRFRFPWS